MVFYGAGGAGLFQQAAADKFLGVAGGGGVRDSQMLLDLVVGGAALLPDEVEKFSEFLFFFGGFCGEFASSKV